jgi:hypothetical protein
MSGEQEFRATTDQMLDMIDRLRASERSKQNVDYGSPQFVELAAEAERLSRIVFRWASMQMQMAGVAASAVSRGEQSPAPLAEVVPRRLDRILANWREAQMRLEIAKPGTPEASAAADDLERFREEYRATQSHLVVDDAS